MRTLLTEDRVNAIKRAAIAIASIPGDVAELGVYQGGISRLLAEMLPTKTVHLFDTFSGIPDIADKSIDGHAHGEFAASLDEVRAYLFDCPNVVYHVGIFPSTAAGDTFSLVHLDGDLYESTRAGIEYFWPRLSPGGKLVFDDWNGGNTKGVNKAIVEYFGEPNERINFDQTAQLQVTITKPSGVVNLWSNLVS